MPSSIAEQVGRSDYCSKMLHYIKMSTVLRTVSAIAPGRYIVAVSGGVDSMVLLDAVRRLPGLEIIVAHMNHGIREDSQLDAALVRSFCMSHNIPYISKVVNLGSLAGESKARQVRYEFLQHCLNKNKAIAILTAQHQDDLLETVIINAFRGTGWRGLAPFTQTKNVLRPLIGLKKAQLVSYAKRYNVPWREDATNSDQRYLRNYIRRTVMPLFDSRRAAWRRDLLRLIRKQVSLRRTIEAELDTLLTLYARTKGQQTATLRYIWCMLPDREAYELLQALCRNICGHSVLQNQARAALVFAKTAKPGKSMPLHEGWRLRVTRRELIVEPAPSVVS